MTACVDLAEIADCRAVFRRTGLLVDVRDDLRLPRVPSILSCRYDASQRKFWITFDDLSGAYVRRSELEGLGDGEVAWCSLDEYRLGVVVVLVDGTTTSFSGDYARYLRDPSYRRRADALQRTGAGSLAASVAERIRSRRVALGLSQAEFARRLDMAPPNVHRLESGTHVPSTATLLRVAEVLDVPFEALLTTPGRR